MSPRLLDELPPMPDLARPGAMGTRLLQDDNRARLDRQNALVLLEGTRPDAVFIGDSLTAGWPVASTLADLFAVIVNSGVGGDAAMHVHLRLRADAFQLRPRNLFFMLGTNDIAFRFGYDTDDDLLDRMLRSYRFCFEMIRAEGLHTYLGTVPPVRRTMLEDTLFERKRGLLPRVNDALRRMADDYGFVLVDYYAEMTGEDGQLPAALTTDGCHLTALGYWLMDSLVRRVVAESPPVRG